MKRSFLFALILAFGFILISGTLSSFVVPAVAEEVTIDLPEGWSLFSLPVMPDSSVLSDLFPDAEVVYRYEKDSGYIRVNKEEENLEFGIGYWIFLNNAKSYTLTGELTCEYPYTIHEDGWYMIGGTSYPSYISIEKGEIIVLYRYTKGAGYQRVLKSGKMEPGKGYWILLKDIQEATNFNCYCFEGHDFMQDSNRCQECHLGNPVFGQTDYRDLKFRDNIVNLCYGCHTKESLAASHPVNIVPPGHMNIPEDLHLDENMNMTCATCHEPHSEISYYPYYLRRSNEQSILCLACHHEKEVNGPHRDAVTGSPKGVCASCHIPHKAKSDNKIWAVNLKGEFDGVHDLCYSCHNSEDASTQSGGDNVFLKGRYENHVMFGGAVIEAGNCPNAPSLFTDKYSGQFPWARNFDNVTFPLDPNDRDRIPEKDDGIYCGRLTFSYREGGVGFYCGTCHNPHKDLSETSDGDGDYLRSKPEDQTSIGLISIGKKGKRRPFCIQCHGVVHENLTNDCLVCHHPHKGKTFIREDESIGRLILIIEPLPPKDFIAIPNVPEITDDPNSDQYTSRFCYSCHNLETSQASGIHAVYGDDALGMKKEHHPMGTQASTTDTNKFRGGIFVRAPGTPLQLLNTNGQLTCTSCHDNDHGLGPFTNLNESKANEFLRWVLNDNDERDRVDFCVVCHIDKSGSNIYGKHLISSYDSPNGRGGCMFCHFIHDGEERQDTVDIGINGLQIRPDVDALMRFPSLNLSWGDKTGDTDIYDYEDLCFGCHGEQNIVGGSGINGSLLEPNAHFTHPFSLPANLDLIGERFSVSDGSDLNITDDYGVRSGHIYCGTCHDTHNNQTQPYLENHPTPYLYQAGDGFCEACHNKDGKFVSESHPIGVGPNANPAQGAPTAPQFADTYNGGNLLFSQGGSGRPGGITAPYDPATANSTMGGTGKVICLTCHNIHAAVTSWEGKTKTDLNNDHGFLLVKDNIKERSPVSPGSELCKACHPFGESEYSFPGGAHGDATLSGGEGICSACHRPHGSGDPKLWSIECPSSQDPDRGCYEIGPFEGFRQLCFSCHNNNYVLPGSKTVFKSYILGDQNAPEDYYPEDHVMRFWADINGVADFDTNYFPLDANDRDTIPTILPDQKSQDGFYCGTCHNPHMQPDSGGGYYLRSKGGDIGSYGSREGFCNQCHEGIHDGTSYENIECLTCHHPHNGSTTIDEDPNIGRLILN